MSNIPIKSPREIEKMRQGRPVSASARCSNKVGEFIRPGVLTREVDLVRRGTHRRSGGLQERVPELPPVFRATSASAVNEQVVHGIGASAQRFCTATSSSWTSASSRTVGWGTRPRRWRSASFRPVDPAAPASDRRARWNCAIPFAREGRRLNDVSVHHREPRGQKRVFSVVREFVGHGVGRKLHEEPQVPNYKAGDNPKLRAGHDAGHRADGQPRQGGCEGAQR